VSEGGLEVACRRDEGVVSSEVCVFRNWMWKI
jgi:hypothetical protein